MRSCLHDTRQIGGELRHVRNDFPSDVGCVKVDDHHQSSLEGFYAAGDVVSDLRQLSVAEGHVAIAATAIRNSLPHNFRRPERVGAFTLMEPGGAAAR